MLDALDPTAPSAAQHFAYDDADPALNARGRAIDDVISRADQNYAGLTVDEANNSVTVYWKGQPPAAVAAQARSASGTTVRFVPGAAFGRATVMAASQKLIGSSEWTSKLGVTMASTNSDGTGLTVFVEGAQPSAKLQAELETFLGLPAGTTFVPNSKPPTPEASRQADSAPYSGGGRLKFNLICTAGYSVLFGSTGKLATAHHCDPSGSLAVKTGAGKTIAPNSQGKPAIDSKMVDPTASPATGAYIYTGAYNSSTKTSVKEWYSNNTGDSVCLSGATSGTRCGKIINDATQIPGLTQNFYIRAQANSGWMSAGGDSGGPWYKTVSGGVQARGIHWGGDGAATCGAIDPNASATCSKTSLYVPISVVLNTWGATLEVR